jgi:hypothetical protein
MRAMRRSILREIVDRDARRALSAGAAAAGRRDCWTPSLSRRRIAGGARGFQVFCSGAEQCLDGGGVDPRRERLVLCDRGAEQRLRRVRHDWTAAPRNFSAPAASRGMTGFR